MPSTAGDTAAEDGFRMVADAGVIPREIELRKPVDAQSAALATADPEGWRVAMAWLADLDLRLASQTEAWRCVF